MKKTDYVWFSITAAFNSFIALLAADSKILAKAVVKCFIKGEDYERLAKAFLTGDMEREQELIKYLRFPGIIIAAGTVVGLVLTVVCVIKLLGYYKKIPQNKRALTLGISAFLATSAGIGACYALCREWKVLFLISFILAFGALCVLVTAAYKALSLLLEKHSRIGTVITVLFSVVFLFMALVAVSSSNLGAIADFENMGTYGVSIAVSVLLFLFGAVALVGTFVKKLRFSWVKPTVAVLAALLICLSAFTVFVTGRTGGTGNIVKDAAIDVSVIRLGLTEADYVCAYNGIDGERVYLLKRAIDRNQKELDSELSELLDGVKIGDVYHRTVNGVEYKHISLNTLSDFYVFRLIPA